MIPIVSSSSDLVFKFLRCQNENSRYVSFHCKKQDWTSPRLFFAAQTHSGRKRIKIHFV